MKEYIEREALYEFLTEQLEKETGAYSKGRNAGIKIARSALHNRQITPAVGIAEVVHGKWNRTSSDYECSKCSYPMNYITPFCPYCGAKMDLDEETK